MSSRNGTRSENAGVCVPLLRITTTTISGTAQVLHLHGESDHDQRRRLESALERAVAECPPRLVVDLAGLTFCDSTCLNALLKTRIASCAAGIPLVLAAPTPQTCRLLEITGADEVLTIHDSVRAALATTEPHTG
ncbi:STAS domain-containing protein [Kitasatospora sp. DSM 101779]|uniref:STAS domain-containing protein n=1 Tax=Kitasatospora sp. DSM 101779 TaxID=2853165 RepID=UPI0021D97CE0|nr:STAS domain-containing protein [Kitasatospora sp. DSM 101779]MCU7826785.1 STAS domain-containing protein [Kitasatospora sp. DSM 101779]